MKKFETFRIVNRHHPREQDLLLTVLLTCVQYVFDDTSLQKKITIVNDLIVFVTINVTCLFLVTILRCLLRVTSTTAISTEFLMTVSTDGTVVGNRARRAQQVLV